MIELSNSFHCNVEPNFRVAGLITMTYMQSETVLKGSERYSAANIHLFRSHCHLTEPITGEKRLSMATIGGFRVDREYSLWVIQNIPLSSMPAT